MKRTGENNQKMVNPKTKISRRQDSINHELEIPIVDVTERQMSFAKNQSRVQNEVLKPIAAKDHTGAVMKLDRRHFAKSGEAPGPTYKDKAAAAIHESLSGPAGLGSIGESTVRSFEKIALEEIPKYTAERVKSLRDREKATQAVFAMHLGVSINTVSQWERGERAVSGAAAKLLSLVDKHGLAHLI